MPRAYSRDLRERLLQAVTSGLSVVEVARITGVSASTIGRYTRKAATGASLEPGISPGGPRKITASEEDALRAQVAAAPDATLAEHCATWTANGHVPVSISTMCRALARLGLPRKKDADRDRTRRGRPCRLAQRDGRCRSRDGRVSG